MSKHTRTPSHFKIYCHNKSLLFQFILSDLVVVSKKITILQQLIGSMNVSPSLPIFLQIKAELRELIPFPVTEKQKISWQMHEGILDKLKNHCELFLQKYCLEDKNFFYLLHFVNNTRLQCLKCIDLLPLINLSLGDSTGVITLNLLIKKMGRSIRTLGESIGKICEQFREDENVIFFLLCHHLQLEELYGSHFVTKLFNQFYSNGLKEVSRFLKTKYLGRGFNQLLSTISAKIEELESYEIASSPIH